MDTAWFSDGAAPWKPDKTFMYSSSFHWCQYLFCFVVFELLVVYLQDSFVIIVILELRFSKMILSVRFGYFHFVIYHVAAE